MSEVRCSICGSGDFVEWECAQCGRQICESVAPDPEVERLRAVVGTASEALRLASKLSQGPSRELWDTIMVAVVQARTDIRLVLEDKP